MTERGGESQRWSGGSSGSSSRGGDEVRGHERRHANRKTVLAAIESKLS